MIYKLCINLIKRKIENYSKNKIINTIPNIKEVIKETKSTGVSYVDMWCLYRDLKRKKPLCVLECGPGVSTYIISYALYENYKENNVESELISLEENELFFKGLDKCVFSKFKDKT